MACKTFHKGKYYVTFKRGFEDCKKEITIIIDKVFETDALKVGLSDEGDPTFLCVIQITRIDYEDLKKQQGLLIDFDNFPAQLVRLLQQCAANNMFLIMQQTNPIQYHLEVVEHNEFKRLVHLSLRTGPATDADIKQHMAETIIYMKKALLSMKSTSASSEALWNDKCLNLERKVHDLTHVVSKMEEDRLRRDTEYQDTLRYEKEKIAQERLQLQKNADMNMKTQLTASQDTLNRKDKHIDELNNLCKQLRDNIGQLENQLSDKIQRISFLESEVQKTHIEVATLKAKNATLERDTSEKDKQYNQINSKCLYLEKAMKDNADTIKDLNNTIQSLKREKMNVEERLALSESLAQKNNEAVHSTSEQLLKANQIITKQNADLIEMKEKLLCRTAIALEQEKVIERNTKEIEDMKCEIRDINKYNVTLKQELNNLKEKHDAAEIALKDRDETIKNNNMVIQWLHKKMENAPAHDDMMPSRHKLGITTATSSTPYFLPKNNYQDSSQPLSEESIDFYATSKLSNVEGSQSSDERIKTIGLDPKYLKPATSENHANSMKAGKLKTNSAQNGKENVNLPTVDYREKKSSRGPTYRATPVSAYFP